MRIIFILLLWLSVASTTNAQKKFLFDATKAETAGNADWVIDEDNNVPQRFPTPAQSTITVTTPETYWTGALSSWGIALVKLGHTVETLPTGTAITYGNASNPQDLSNYNVFIIDEPNTPFTASEKTAIVSFVQNGGGLFAISDHAGADRNNDGWDAVRVWNDLFRTNSIQPYPFGILVDSTNFSETTSNVLADTTNRILHGSQGTVTQLQYSNGASLTLNPSVNPNVRGLIWQMSASQGNTNLMCASSVYGTGRVVMIGDSSPADDGTGAPGNTLYTGWTDVPSHAYLHLNASLWLAKVGESVTAISPTAAAVPTHFALEQNYPNPFNPTTTITYWVPSSNAVSLNVYDVLGREVAVVVNERKAAGRYAASFDASKLTSGIYFYRLTTGGYTQTKKMVLVK
jgi:hypothetical protein